MSMDPWHRCNLVFKFGGGYYNFSVYICALGIDKIQTIGGGGGLSTSFHLLVYYQIVKYIYLPNKKKNDHATEKVNLYVYY